MPPKISRFVNSDSPIKRIVNPIPDTCWFAPSVTVSNAISAPARSPTTIAAASPSSNEPVEYATAKPVKAPAYIVPSMPRLRTPDRSA